MKVWVNIVLLGKKLQLKFLYSVGLVSCTTTATQIMYTGANIHVNYTTFCTFGCEVHGDGCPRLGVPFAHADHAAVGVVGDGRMGIENSSCGEVELSQNDSAEDDGRNGPHGEVGQVGIVI